MHYQVLPSECRNCIGIVQQLLRNSGDEKAIAKNLKSLEKTNQAIAELFKPPIINNQHIRGPVPEPVPSTDNWNITVYFTPEGATKFAELTKNLAGTGRSIGIFLNNQLLSAPTVGVEFAKTGITGGQAVIQGRFTAEQAKELAIELSGGVLPIR